MGISEDRLSTTTVSGTYLDPDGRVRSSLNTDWEAGPVAVIDTSEGLNYQAWQLTFAGGTFTITPETTGSPVVVLPNIQYPALQDSTQCCLAFDSNARVNLAWIDSTGASWLFYYDTVTAQFEIVTFGSVGGIALYLDDKRDMESGISDLLLWYTVYDTDHWVLYHRKQRDRFLQAYEMLDPALEFITRSGMHEQLRGQLTLSYIG